MQHQDKITQIRLRDIQAIHFGDDVASISASMLIVLTLYKSDDVPEIIEACKLKLIEGVEKLRELGAEDEAQNYLMD